MHNIRRHRDLPRASLPGLDHITIAGQEQGLTQLSVWKQVVEPGGATPPHRHDCDEIVICTRGRGELHIHGKVLPFAADESMVIDRNAVHQIFNTGDEPMENIGIFGMTPVEVYLPDGERLELPWSS
ncbi:MAG: cupin domain-containing protein [Telluria sp.]